MLDNLTNQKYTPKLFPPLTKGITSIQIGFLDTVTLCNINVIRFLKHSEHLTFTHPSSLPSRNRQQVCTIHIYTHMVQTIHTQNGLAIRDTNKNPCSLWHSWKNMFLQFFKGMMALVLIMMCWEFLSSKSWMFYEPFYQILHIHF